MNSPVQPPSVITQREKWIAFGDCLSLQGQARVRGKVTLNKVAFKEERIGGTGVSPVRVQAEACGCKKLPV
jgi:hypothetical protein